MAPNFSFRNTKTPVASSVDDIGKEFKTYSTFFIYCVRSSFVSSNYSNLRFFGFPNLLVATFCHCNSSYTQIGTAKEHIRIILVHATECIMLI